MKTERYRKKWLVGLFSGLALVMGQVRRVSAAGWDSECVTIIDGIEVATMQGILCVFERAFMFVIPVVGMAALIALFMGAYKVMMSGGTPEGLKKGWGLITYAVLGIVAIIAGYILIRLIQDFTGVDVTTVTL